MGVADDKTRIVLTVSKELKSRVERQAKKENRSVANLINTLLSDYLWNSEEKEQQLYLTYLANQFLNNNFNYNYYLEKLQEHGFDFSNMDKRQIFSYVRGYVVSNYDDILIAYANDINLTLEKFNASSKSKLQTFDFNTNPFYKPNKD